MLVAKCYDTVDSEAQFTCHFTQFYYTRLCLGKYNAIYLLLSLKINTCGVNLSTNAAQQQSISSPPRVVASRASSTFAISRKYGIYLTTQSQLLIDLAARVSLLRTLTISNVSWCIFVSCLHRSKLRSCALKLKFPNYQRLFKCITNCTFKIIL